MRDMTGPKGGEREARKQFRYLHDRAMPRPCQASRRATKKAGFPHIAKSRLNLLAFAEAASA
jgi:hypothetical protein